MNEVDSTWEKVAGDQQVYPDSNYVTAMVGHFSIYCLIGSEGIEISNVMNYPNPFKEGTGW